MRDDNYIPSEDDISFIDKSIKGILKILSIIKIKDNTLSGFIYEINPLLKLISVITIILLSSLSKNLYFIFCILVYYMLVLSSLQAEDIIDILKVSMVVPIFTAIILIPSILMGNTKSSIAIIIKVFTAVISVNIMSHTTKNEYIIKSFKALFIPNIFILTFHITIKYIQILSNASIEMLTALKLKSIGKNENKFRSLHQIMGVLFLKSKYMAEDTYEAMICRGFTGEYDYPMNFSWCIKDFIFILVNLFFIIVFFMC